MKEFFLVPSSEMKTKMSNNFPNPIQVTTTEPNIPHRTEAAKNIAKELYKDQILENNINLPAELVLKLYERIKRLENPNSIPKEKSDDIIKEGNSSDSIGEEKDSLKKNEQKEEGDIEMIIEILPKFIRLKARELFNHLIKTKVINLNKFGMISIRGTNKTIRLEDLLRVILIKNARVEHIKHLLFHLLPKIPNEFIRNEKVLLLKTKGSGSIRKRNYDVLSTIGWMRI